MKIQRTIKIIDRELSITLEEYNKWFTSDENLIRYSPKAGWSIEQILEHVTLTNHFLLILIRKGKKKALELSLKANLINIIESYQYNLGELEDISKHNSFEWIRPEHMEPKGETELSEIKTLLDTQFNECKLVLNELSNGEGVLYKTTMTVKDLGKIDVYQYIYFLCQHAKRHLSQMQSVEAEYRGFEEVE